MADIEPNPDEPNVQQMLAREITPLASLRVPDAVRLVRLQSIAYPPTTVAG